MPTECPSCRTSLGKPTKTWRYGHFTVNFYVCGNCNTQFREYSKEGKYAFTLKLEKGKGYIKA